MVSSVEKSRFIHRVSKHSLVEIVEKSFPTRFGDVVVKSGESFVSVEAYTPNTPTRQIAKVTFTDYDVCVESEIDFPRNEEVIEFRFLDLMLWLFESENYQELWDNEHAKDFNMLQLSAKDIAREKI